MQIVQYVWNNNKKLENKNGKQNLGTADQYIVQWRSVCF